MKAVHVSDSSPLAENAVSSRECIIVVNRSGFIDRKTWKDREERIIPLSLPVECFFDGTCEIEISVDEEMLAHFQANLEPGEVLPFKNVDELLVRVREYAQAMWEEEQAFYTSVQGQFPALEVFYKKPLPPLPLRIGWGSGLLGATVVTLIADEEMRKRLRDEVISPTGSRPWRSIPASRRICVLRDNREQPFLPFGWVELERIGHE